MKKIFYLAILFISTISYGQTGTGDAKFRNVTATTVKTDELITSKITGIDSTQIDNANGPGDSLVLYTAKGLKFKKVRMGSNFRFDYEGDSVLILNSANLSSTQTFYPKAGDNTTNTEGFTAASAGTLTARIPTTTSLLTEANRVGLVSSTALSNVIYYTTTTPTLWRGSAAGRGGFNVTIRFAIATNATASFAFVGLTANTISSNVIPSTLFNVIGVGKDAADANFQFIYNDTTGTASKVNTAIPINTTDIYELNLSCVSGASAINITFKDISTGTSATNNAVASIPLRAQMMKPILYMSNNTSASAVAYDILKIYTETNH